MAELVGHRVSLHSLKGRAELNGRVGTAISFSATSMRVGVRLEGLDKPLALKAENLTAAGPTEAAAAPAAATPDAIEAFAEQMTPRVDEVLNAQGIEGARRKVEMRASSMAWLTRPFKSGSASMRHMWFIDVYRTRVDDDMKRSAPHGVAMPGASAETIVLDFLQFCRLATAHGAVPTSSSSSRVAEAWDWATLLAAAPAKLAKKFNPELCKAEAYYGAEMGGGSELRALATKVYADGADEEAASVADAILRETEERCFRVREDDGGQAVGGGRPQHVLSFEDASIFEDVGGPQPWRELLAALTSKLT
jgi:hypothetical protein